MQQLIAQKVNAIIFYPLDPKATVPVLKQAKKQGHPSRRDRRNLWLAERDGAVPAVHRDAGLAGTRHPGLPADQALAAAAPRAKVGLIGIGFPVPALKYLNQREAFWAKKAGMTVLGTQDNPSDDVTGGEKAANGLVQRYSDMNAIIGYNDPSARRSRRSPRAAPAGRSLSSA